jgi:hypothetical protein
MDISSLRAAYQYAAKFSRSLNKRHGSLGLRPLTAKADQRWPQAVEQRENKGWTTSGQSV